VTMQANNDSFLSAKSPSQRGMSVLLTGGVRRAGAIIWIILILFAHNISQASAYDKTLVTDHFVINFNTPTSAYTLAIASRLEAYNAIISSFFETDFLERVNVYVYYDQSSSSADNNTIYVSTAENFFDTQERIYRELFFIYLERLMHSKGLAKLDKNFISALISFPELEHKIEHKTEQEIHTLFIYYIISNFGKKIFIQSLKDTKYYGGFCKSLSKITGESIDKISDNFNLFLQKSGKDISDIKNAERLLNDRGDKFSDRSFTASRDNLTVTAEIIKTGSKIHLLNIAENKITDSFFIPMVFIREINLVNSETLVFSAYCGLNIDVYTFNIKSRELKIVRTAD